MKAAFQNSVKNNLLLRRDFSLLILDLDSFKAVNDTFGHQTGDLVLREFSRVLSDYTRERDQVFRYGGDEFTIILNGAKNASVLKIAARIQKAIVNNRLLSKFNISCSIGSAHYQTDDDLSSLCERADQALYLAKNKGKNCI